MNTTACTPLSSENWIVRQDVEPDNQVSRITAFVSGANACSVHITPASMALESGWFSVAIGFDLSEEAMSLIRTPMIWTRIYVRIEHTSAISTPCVDLQILKL